ncbi:hypothetical protein VTL71DRAFT_3007, partial [Oculimacula yallundae]
MKRRRTPLTAMSFLQRLHQRRCHLFPERLSHSNTDQKVLRIKNPVSLWKKQYGTRLMSFEKQDKSEVFSQPASTGNSLFYIIK